ncbi:hypothetical protein B0T17DRAFT_546239 [Bombardia bombarda]|uniref:Uncharacterized protein n=1 Tax=Bombardia bombarda TaxID=252184 RepID=A0AA39TJQ0_9PEZI|nr:hypothetical protein B0T17DRAFT_546239 [Bombardia bombarda]
MANYYAETNYTNSVPTIDQDNNMPSSTQVQVGTYQLTGSQQPYRYIALRFGTPRPSSGPTSWVLAPHNDWDPAARLLSDDGLRLLSSPDVQEIHIELAEEFLFDTFTLEQAREAASSALQHQDLMQWASKLLSLYTALNSANKTRLAAVRIHVHGLGENSSMSDYAAIGGEEQLGPGVLRPTERVYREFIQEFVKLFGQGVSVAGPKISVEKVVLSGVYPGDWAEYVREGMPGVALEKDLQGLMEELRWWTDDEDQRAVEEGEEVLRLYGPGGPPAEAEGMASEWEERLRRYHALAKIRMVSGRAARAGHGHVDGDEDEDEVVNLSYNNNNNNTLAQDGMISL